MHDLRILMRCLHVQDVETMAQVESLLTNNLAGDFSFHVGLQNTKHPLSLDQSSLLNRTALLTMAWVLGLNVGKVKAPGRKLTSMLRQSALFPVERDKRHVDIGFLHTSSSVPAPEAQRGMVLSHRGMRLSNACLQLGLTGVIMMEGTSEVVLNNVEIQGMSLVSKCCFTLLYFAV